MQQSLYGEFGRLYILELYYLRTVCCLLSHVVWLIMLSWQKEFAQLLCDWMDLENVQSLGYNHSPWFYNGTDLCLVKKNYSRMLLFLKLAIGHGKILSNNSHFFFFLGGAHDTFGKVFWQKKIWQIQVFDFSFYILIPMVKSTYKIFTFQISLPF